jgi:uncharacterized protein YneF (UPF0154 family)
LKQIVTFLLAILIFLQVLCKVGIYLSFKINQDYIAKNLCENRNKPKMHCNGNCQLMKKLKNSDKEEQKQIPQSLKDKFEVLYCHDFQCLSLCTLTYFFVQRKDLYGDKSYDLTSFHPDIFQPPKRILI